MSFSVKRTVWKTMASFSKYLCRGNVIRCLGVFFIIFLAIELVVVNVLVFHAYQFVQREISEFSDTKSDSFVDFVIQNKRMKSLLWNAKSKGIYSSILRESLERVYIVHNNNNSPSDDSQHCLKDVKGRELIPISFIGLDVSHSREATYIYNRIQMRKDFPYHFLVVDLGANDGFLSSNSFNFIQWGWDALLVEPMESEIRAAKINIEKYIDRYSEGNQKVIFEKAAIAVHDGSLEFVQSDDSLGMESHVKYGDEIKERDTLVTVACMTVRTLAVKHHIPKNFGVLSIDVEGMGAEILRQWMELDYRPAYIIFEVIHHQEPIQVTETYLRTLGYRRLGVRGWNIIFEHDPSMLIKKKKRKH